MTTALTTLPPGVTPNTEPCWVLAYADGKRYTEDEGAPHYDTETDAQAHVERGLHPDEPTTATPAPVRLDSPCFEVATVCGYALDENDAHIEHFENAQAAYKAAVGTGFRPFGGGLACPAEWRCDECAEAIAEYEREHPGPVPVAEGQEPLIEVPA